MKIISFAILSIILLLASCAGGPGLDEKAPDWIDAPLDSSDAVRTFRGLGEGHTLNAAKASAMANLKSRIMEAMEIGESGSFNALFEKISAMITSSGTDAVHGIGIIHNTGWKNTNGAVSYIIDITWDNETFEKQRAYLKNLDDAVSPGYKDMGGRATDAEKEGNYYEAALLWAGAAGTAQDSSNNPGFRLALAGLVKALGNLNFQLVSYPEKALVGLRPESSVLFLVTSGGKPVSNAIFTVSYPKNNRDNSPGRGRGIFTSDDQGIVQFLPPEVPFSGSQIVTIAPSANPFLDYLHATRDEDSKKVIEEAVEAIENPRMLAEYEATSRIRTIPTGILILETDLAGNPLDTTDTVRGLLDDLGADGFNIRIMDLDPSQILSRTGKALLRDLKADTRFPDIFQRVIYGTVSLDSFEQKGDTYTVKVSGTLFLADINRQVILYESRITKSSQASSSLQAISAAFRQLGRSFAEELILLAP